MADLTDAVLLAASAWPGTHTAEFLADELERDLDEITAAVADLRGRGLLQRRRGRPTWGGTDRLRASKAGVAACRVTLRAEILEG